MELRKALDSKSTGIVLSRSSAGDSKFRFNSLSDKGSNMMKFDKLMDFIKFARGSSKEVDNLSRETAFDALVVAKGLGPNFLEESTPDASICGWLRIDKLHCFTVDLRREVIINGHHGGLTSNEDLGGKDALLRVGPDLRNEDLLNSFGVYFSESTDSSHEVAVTNCSLCNVPRFVL